MNFEQARFNMVEQQIRPWDVLDQKVLDTIMNTPREDFVPSEYRNLAFSDINIPLGNGEVMMQPNVEGRLLQTLQVQSSDLILQVGTGSGYLTACLATLGKHVVSLDTYAEFTKDASSKLSAHNVNNVTLTTIDSYETWDPTDQYDAIVLTGSVASIPTRYKEALNTGGRLFAVVGSVNEPTMEALLVTKTGDQQWLQESLFETSLAPLVSSSTKPPEFEF